MDEASKNDNNKIIKYFDSDDSDIEKPKITEVRFHEESSSVLSKNLVTSQKEEDE